MLDAGSARGVAGWGQQDIQDALLGGFLSPEAHARHFLFAVHLDRHVHQVAHDGFHVATHIAHLGELGRFDLDEGRVGQFGQAPGDLRFADAGGPDHQDILGRDLGAQFLGQLHAPPAIAQRNGDCALGGVLANDVFVQFVNNLAGGHIGHAGT